MTGRGWIGIEDVADETEDTVPDDETCIECGFLDGEHADDCMGVD